MKHIPYCRKCMYYGGRKNGIGICNCGKKPLLAEHIKSDFWCIKGKKREG